ncbi:MAG: hypothetical protein Q4D37_10810 [Oscillospiraceae bacterium]|nr:hypothetical protein [Oscillospiraceae bacterium]
MKTKTTNRVISFAAAIMMMLSMLILLPQDIVVAAGGTLLGDGTSENPYQVSDADDLYAFAEKINNAEKNICAVLTNDIVVNENVLDANGDLNSNSSKFKAWKPIGYSQNTRYKGTFDGQGHTISGLYLNSGTYQYCGLFGWIDSGSTVKNVGVEDSYIKSIDKGDSSAESLVGGITGYNSGTIHNCYNAGTIIGSNSYLHSGGIAGKNVRTITNCYNTGKVISEQSRAGGITGRNYGTISNCYNSNSSNVNGTGITDYNSTQATLHNCYYLADSEKDGNDGTTFKTEEQFASGEVAYLLQQGQEDQTIQVWGQKIGTDELPRLASAYPVYYVDATAGTCECIDLEKGYYNIEKIEYINGFCSNCGRCQPATLNEDGVYEIFNAGQLYWFAEYVNNGNTSANAILMNDIVINENVLDANGNLNGDGVNFRQWTPIGNDSNSYIGKFDGQNYAISGLYSNTTDNGDYGLFGYIGSGGTVQNVNLMDNYIKSSGRSSSIAAYNDGTLSDCSNAGTIIGEEAYGIVNGTNCSNTGKVSAEGINAAAYGIFEGTNCSNAGTIIGEEAYGIVNGTNCSNTGKVSAEGTNAAAHGISRGTNCYNTGEIGANGTNATAYGIFGGTNCYNTGEIGANGTNAAAYGISEGTNCYSTGKISADGTDATRYNITGGSNCYYLSESQTEDGGKTAEQFASGEVAYLLQKGQKDQTTQVWGQKIGTDDLPRMTESDTVYRSKQYCDGSDIEDAAYTNAASPIQIHKEEGAEYDESLCS